MVGLLENINLFYGNMDTFANLILNNKEKKKYFAINTDCYNIADRDEEYRNILLDNTNVIYVDGAGIIMGQKMTKGKVSEERIATTDLFIELLNHSNQHKVYLLGGRKGTAEKVIENMKDKYPKVNFVGSYHGFFDKSKSECVINDINEKKPDILFIGFGCPSQEKWVNDNFEDILATNFVTCGGLFDYYSDNVKRAPLWVQKAGLEWFFRFLQEPRRLFKRYFFGNTIFLLKIIRLKMNGKKL